MHTLIRFYETSICITSIHIHNYDIIKNTIHWLISHDIGNLQHIISSFRLYSRHLYNQNMQLYNYDKKIESNIDYTIDIGKINGHLIVKFTNIQQNKYIIDTPQILKYKLNL